MRNRFRHPNLTHKKGINTLADYDWTFDANGRITKFVSGDGTSDYTYDNSGQLTGANHTYQTNETYTYDSTGNRTNIGYTTGTNNRVTSDGSFDYLYDDEGNRTKKTDKTTGDYVEYDWDHRNHLIAVTFRDSLDVKTKEVTYNYDAFDRRIAKHVDDNGNGTIDSSEYYVYDGSDIVLVFDGSNNLTERILQGPLVDQVFAAEDNANNVLWALTDNQGTVRDIVDYNSGTDTTTVSNHIKYDAFGNITAESDSSVEFLYSYTGRVYDEDSELYYYRARWYDPSIGRFIGEDPLGFAAGDVNLSRYVGNSTPNFTDPSGLDRTPSEISSDFAATGTPEPDEEFVSTQSKGDEQKPKPKSKQKKDKGREKINEFVPPPWRPTDVDVVFYAPKQPFFTSTLTPWAAIKPPVLFANPAHIPWKGGVLFIPEKPLPFPPRLLPKAFWEGASVTLIFNPDGTITYAVTGVISW